MTQSMQMAVVTILSLGLVSPVTVSHAGEPADLPKLIGKPAPLFTVRALDGRAVTLADYKGKVLLLNFWATWCGPCIEEMPWLAQLREQYQDQGFEILGVLTNNASPEKIYALLSKAGVKYPIAMCNHPTAQAYGGLPSLPVSIYVGRDGKVIEEAQGADSRAEIEQLIRKALAAKQSPD